MKKFSKLILTLTILTLTAAGCRAESPEIAPCGVAKLRALENFLSERGRETTIVTVGEKPVLSVGDVSYPADLHSIGKSLVAALAGVAVADGSLSLKETLAAAAWEEKEPLSPKESGATWNDLLKFRSGVYHPAAREFLSWKALKPARESRAPGQFWFYNEWDANSLAHALERRYGRSVGGLFLERIAKPLGMNDFSAASVEVRRSPESLSPSYLFRLSARDLSRFGTLLLGEGKWDNTQLLPRGWVKRTLRPYSRTSEAGVDAFFGYFSWWVGFPFDYAERGGARLLASAWNRGPETYLSYGLGGKFLLLVPERRMVVVRYLHSTDEATDFTEMGNFMQAVWDSVDCSSLGAIVDWGGVSP